MISLRSSVRRVCIGVAFVPLLMSCGGEGGGPPTTPKPPPVPATLAIDLTTPNADDGAVLFTIVGPGIDSVTSGSYAVSVGTSSTAARVLVYGNLAAGLLAKVHI